MPVRRNIFQAIPFIRITSLFLAGIILNHFFHLNSYFSGTTFTLLICTLIFFWFNTDFHTSKIQNFLVSVCILFCGFFYHNANNERQIPSFSSKNYFLAEVCQKPIQKTKSFQTILLIRNDKLVEPEKIIAYFSTQNFDSTITTGDQLIAILKPQLITNSGNPFEFDYQMMMNQKGIWYSAYLPYGTYLKTGEKTNRLKYIPEQIRDKLVVRLTEVLPSKEERSVVSALTLGYRAELDKETLDYFASTGAMHVLSVSGLHVALIYYILGVLLAFLKRGKSGNTIFSVLMLAALWFYAIVTGFSPSVQRATVMFSFVIIGNSLRRPSNIFNSLTASALFLVLLNPNVIFDIGFQLSYLAVIGIVLIQPQIEGMLKFKNALLKKAWALFAVSVAAQLATFPLGLYYFNQFPNLFWLSNYIVIPITTLIIWLVLAFFVLIPFQSLAILIGQGIQELTFGMLYILKEIDSLPYAVSDGIILNQRQTIALYFVLVSMLIFLYSKNRKWLLSGMMAILIVQTDALFVKMNLINQKSVYVYNSPNTVIHLINGRTNYLITDTPDSIPAVAKNTIERVKNNLMLYEPNVIDIKSLPELSSDELIISSNHIQFLNCLINLPVKSENRDVKNTDLMRFQSSKYNSRKNETADTTFVYSNSYSDAKKVFVIDLMNKQKGAFALKL